MINGPCEALISAAIDTRVLMLIGVAALLIMSSVILLTRLQIRARSRLHSRTGRPNADDTKETPTDIFAAEGTPLFRCHAELVERRPLSEAQWDSPVPAAWTIFRLRADDSAALQVGLLLPVQHKEAYSSGFIERIDGSSPDLLLRGFAEALGSTVPGPAITGSSTGFLEFKTFVRNDMPEIIPGNLDLSAADYWIFVKIFVQNSLDFYMRINAHRQEAEIAADRPEQGEALMRMLAQTLRPETAI